MHKTKQLLVFCCLASLVFSPPVPAKEQKVDNVYEGGVSLTITTRPFDPKGHKITMCGETVCVIDGKPVYGTYGRMPKEEVFSLVLEKGGKKISLDVSAMYNPNVTNSNIKKYVKVYSFGDDTYQVSGYFSHDDGDDDMYICLWTIMADGSIRNHLSEYNSLSILTTEVRKDFNLEP